jgi:hypothetical protein
MFGSTAIVLIAGMLIKQVSRLITVMEQDRRADRYLPEAAQPEPPQLSSQPPTFRSVTEHTTRNFDAAYREPQAHE